VGGKYGEGVLCARRPDGTYSPPSFYTVAGGSYGFQVGVESIDLVLVIMSDRGLQSLLKSKVKLGADVGVAAGPVGRRAAAATDVLLKAEIYSYSRSKGLFAGLSLEGATMFVNDDANRAFYGKELSANRILYKGVPGSVPPVAKDLITNLNHLSRPSQ